MSKRRWIGAALVVLAGFLAAWANTASSRGALALPDAAAGGALAPLAHGFNAVGAWASDVARVATRRDDIVAENARLRERVARLEAEGAQLARVRRENAELRRLLDTPAPPGARAIAAEVVWAQNSPLARRLTLNVGRNRGVAAKDVVTSAEGLVGQVTQVGARTSVVTLLTDREGAVGAVVARSGAKGVVRGVGERSVTLDYLDYSADVRAGDLVVTSGLVEDRGAVFPRGIPIGRVLSVQKDRTYSSQKASVEPLAPLDRLFVVWVRTAQVKS